MTMLQQQALHLEAKTMTARNELTLSLFPNIGLLDRGFEDNGFCVVRGPDLIWGGDIRRFHAPAGKFDGVFGGSPCQDFSASRRVEPTGDGLEMIGEFVRVVLEAQPVWYLLENVPRVPDVKIAGYSWQRLDLWAHEFGSRQRRNRHFQFGARDGSVLVIEREGSGGDVATVTASDSAIPISEAARLQGLPDGFDIPAFRRSALRRAIGNGVPYPMAVAVAAAIKNRVSAESVKLCACSCGRLISGRKTYARTACRVRAHRRRSSSTAS